MKYIVSEHKSGQTTVVAITEDIAQIDRIVTGWLEEAAPSTDADGEAGKKLRNGEDQYGD